jgi:hypothetical protein
MIWFGLSQALSGATRYMATQFKAYFDRVRCGVTAASPKAIAALRAPGAVLFLWGRDYTGWGLRV